MSGNLERKDIGYLTMQEIRWAIEDLVDIAKGTGVGIGKFVRGEPTGISADKRFEIFAQMVALTGLAEMPVTILSFGVLSLPVAIIGLMAGIFYDPNYRNRS